MWIDDAILRACSRSYVGVAWVPRWPMIVLGRSGKLHEEVNTHASLSDNLPIFRRRGGGGTVLLHEDCVVISIGVWLARPYENDRYFAAFNNLLIAALASHWPKLHALQQRGISDLAWQDRKLVGSSLYRSGCYALYQASLLVKAREELMERYLLMPPRCPDYRRQRSHKDFVGALSTVIQGAQACEVASLLRKTLPKMLQRFYCCHGGPVEEKIATRLQVKKKTRYRPWQHGSPCSLAPSLE